jgi:hexulose-6-phosphate isomerase
VKKGIVVRAFSGNPDFLGSGTFLRERDDYARVFERARSAGFDGVQLFLDRTGYFSQEASDETAAEVASLARDCGITVSSLEIAPFSFSFTTDDAGERERGVRVVTRCLEIASVMGVAGVLTIPGWVGLPWDRSAPTVRYDVAFDRTRDALQQLAPVAERLNASVMLENIWNRFLLSPLEMRSMLDGVGSPRVRSLFDTGNVVLFGYPEQWVAILGDRIQEVHLKDFRQSVGTIEGFVDLLEGDVNWPAVMHALSDVGYDGFLTAEVFPHTYAPDVVIERTSQSIDRMLAMLN